MSRPTAKRKRAKGSAEMRSPVVPIPRPRTRWEHPSPKPGGSGLTLAHNLDAELDALAALESVLGGPRFWSPDGIGQASPGAVDAYINKVVDQNAKERWALAEAQNMRSHPAWDRIVGFGHLRLQLSGNDQVRRAIAFAAGLPWEVGPARDGDKLSPNPSITWLPDGLNVPGSLELFRASLRELPKALVVNGSLDLRYTDLQRIPDDIQIGHSLDIRSSQIRCLPAGLHVKWDLVMQDSLVTELPDRLFVGECIRASGSLVERIGSGVYVGLNLDLQDTKVREIPGDLSVGRSIYLQGTPVRRLPEGIHLTESLDLTGTEIEVVPRGLILGHALILTRSRVHTLSNDLVVRGPIWLFETPLAQKTEAEIRSMAPGILGSVEGLSWSG